MPGNSAIRRLTWQRAAPLRIATAGLPPHIERDDAILDRTGMTDGKWIIEFSLALHNRTGKFFIGKDIIEDQADLIDQVLYWRFGLKDPPRGLAALMIRKAFSLEGKAREFALGRAVLPRLSTRRRVLHLDPFTAIRVRLKPSDIVLCHDLGPITHPELFSPEVRELYRLAYAEIERVAPRMVFVSNASREAFHTLYRAEDDGAVIYPPLRVDLGAIGREPVEAVRAPYLLTVGSLGDRKNQLASSEAFGRSGLAGEGVKLVLCGSREPGYDRVIEAAEATPEVVVLSYVSDGELAWLYDNAAGFVLVSKLEGFGMPVAEAISRGLVPLVAASSVLHEVAGDAALAVRIDDVDAIADGMAQLTRMTPSEKAVRLESLKHSIERFTRERFATAWRSVMTETAKPDQSARAVRRG
jgi:glycosyltransferase involved in cell wall biosynthesis